MFNISDIELQEYINEDVPYLDLTTHLQNISNQKARLEVFTREDIVVSCSEEASKMAQMLGCQVKKFTSSKQNLQKGDVVISFEGDYNDVHKAWRSCQVILEYSCKIATYTKNMKQQIESVNQNCELLTTRKTFPFAKKFCIKSVLAGGGMPHRLSLSETILFFEQHRKVFNNVTQFYKSLQVIKKKAPEKKIVVETHELNDAIELMNHGVDVLQIDKADMDTLKKIIEYKKANSNNNFSDIKILAAGGINLENCKEYAALGVDGIVTSRVYFCGMANMGTRLEIVK